MRRRAALSLAGRSLIGSDVPPTLSDEGTHRLVQDIATLADRGLEHAEAIMHERRQADEALGHHDPRTYQALEALARARRR